jgi:DNA invertase Pin-like site-specific DNA recombinase
LAFDQDRLSRATSWATGAIMTRLIELGVERLVTSSKDVDLLDDTQRAMFGIEQDLSKRAYAKSISRNVCRGLVNSAQAGYWPGGPPPYGYCATGPKKQRVLIRGPELEATAVEELFRLADAGELGVDALAKIANERGWPVPERARQKRCSEWRQSTVYRILTNPVYIGMIRYGHRRQGKYHHAVVGEPLERRGRNQKTPPALLVKGQHEGLVDPAVFNRVNAKFKLRPFGKVGRRRSYFAFGQKLICDCCGLPMVGSSRQELGYVCSTYNNYGKCARNRIHEEELLERVVELLARELNTPATLRRMRKHLEAARSGRGETLRLAVERGQAHVAALAKKVKKVTDRLLIISDDLVPVVENELRSQRAELEHAQKDLADLEAQAAQAQVEDRDIEEALAQLEALPQVLAEAGREERGRIVRGFIVSIRLRFDVTLSPKTGRRRSHWTGGTVTLHGTGRTTREIHVAERSAWAARRTCRPRRPRPPSNRPPPRSCRRR